MYPKNIIAIICFFVPFSQITALTDHELISAWWSKACLERKDEAKAGLAYLDLFAKAQANRQKSNLIDVEKAYAAEACNLIVPPAGSSISILNNIKQQSNLGLAGELYLAKTLLHLESDTKKLLQRQSIITALYSDTNLYETCSTLKHNYGDALEMAIQLYTINQKGIDQHCFSERSLYWFGKSHGLFVPSFLSGIIYSGYVSATYALTGYQTAKEVRSLVRGSLPFFSALDATAYASSVGAKLAILIKIALNYDLFLKKIYEYLDLKKISRTLYQSYYRIIESAYAIRDLSRQYPELAHMETLVNIDLFEQAVNQDDDLKRCFALIQSGPENLWAHEQQTLITLLQKNKDSFAGLFELLAEFETYLAFARLKRHSDAHTVHICFATFNKNDRPYLNIGNFWNPLLDPHKAVPNSLTFDDIHRHMILTGSNTGGKSTLIKGIIANLIFAQTYGLAFADALSFSLFDHIMVSLNIVDNTAIGDSLFLSEIKRAKAIIDVARSCKKCFIVCDELFTGTAAANAGRAVAGVLQKIAQEPKSLSIFATHHGETVTNLGTHKPFFNMKIDTVKSANGSIQHTYTCTPGISTENIADELLRIHLGV